MIKKLLNYGSSSIRINNLMNYKYDESAYDSNFK